jgi:hypothetical protein
MLNLMRIWNKMIPMIYLFIRTENKIYKKTNNNNKKWLKVHTKWCFRIKKKNRNRNKLCIHFVATWNDAQIVILLNKNEEKKV